MKKYRIYRTSSRDAKVWRWKQIGSRFDTLKAAGAELKKLASIWTDPNRGFLIIEDPGPFVVFSTGPH